MTLQTIRASILLGQLADLLTFLCAASVLPLNGEINPLATWLYIWSGAWGVIGLKALSTAGAFVLAPVVDGPGLMRRLALNFIIGLPVLGAISNTVAVTMR